MDNIPEENNKVKNQSEIEASSITLTLFNDSASTKAVEQITLDEFVHRTKTGYWQEEVEAVREALTK